jgi:hypothetical protein
VLTTWYYGQFALCFALLFIADHLLVERRRPDLRSALYRVGGALSLSGLLLSPVLLPMLTLGRSLGRVGDPAGAAQRFSLDPCF